MENVGVEQQSVKFLLSLKSDLNLPEPTVMFGLDQTITLQLKDDLENQNTQSGPSVRDLTHIHPFMIRCQITSCILFLNGKYLKQLIQFASASFIQTHTNWELSFAVRLLLELFLWPLVCFFGQVSDFTWLFNLQRRVSVCGLFSGSSGKCYSFYLESRLFLNQSGLWASNPAVDTSVSENMNSVQPDLSQSSVFNKWEKGFDQNMKDFHLNCLN